MRITRDRYIGTDRKAANGKNGNKKNKSEIERRLGEKQ